MDGKQAQVTVNPSPGGDLFTFVVNEAKSGAWALVVVAIATVIIFRKSALEFIHRHGELVETVTNTNEKHTKHIEELTNATRMLANNNTTLTRVIAKTTGFDLSDLLDHDEDEGLTYRK